MIKYELHVEEQIVAANKQTYMKQQATYDNKYCTLQINPRHVS